MKTLTRSNCFIGKGNWPTDGFSSSLLLLKEKRKFGSKLFNYSITFKMY